nr:hypothetical protein [Tanacetum cinerariifolium]
MAVNNTYQPWGAILSMINQCLTDKANLGSPTKKGRKDKPYVILYCRFTKLIICHLGRIHNIHQRSTSIFHLAEEDLRLGNLKFIHKGEVDEVFGMPIPNELISNNMRNVPYYNAYLEMVAKHDRKVAAETEGKKKTTSTKTPKSKPAIEKSSKPALAPKPKATKERPSKASTAKPPKPKPAKEKSTRTTPLLKSSKVTEEASTGPSAQAQDDTSINIVRDSPSPADAKTKTGDASEKTNSGGDNEILLFDEEQVNDVNDQVNLEEKTDELDQGQAGSDTNEPSKLNAESEVVSMVTVPIHQASSSIMPLSTPIIDLSPPKPSSSMKVPIFTATTTTTTTNLPLPPLHHNKARHILKLRDLPYKINEAVCESMKKAIQIALQAPLRDRFKELPENDMKEILHQRMFESGSYKSLPEHLALYEALEASMKRAQKNEFFAKKDKSRKRRRDDQDPPLPPPVLDLYKRRRHETGASGQCFSHHVSSSSKELFLEKTGDMRTFMHWYCQQMGKTELTQADFEGQAYKVVKAFYPNIVHLQFQMEECHKMLTDQIDWANPEGDQVRIDINKPLPLSGPPVPLMVYLIDGLIVRNFTLTDTLLTQDASNKEWKIMRFNEIYKFNDGTLTNIMEALDFRVKKYKNIRVIPKYHSKDGNPSRANIKQALGSIKVKRTSRTMSNQAFTIKKSMGMPVQLSQAKDGKTPQVDDQRLDLADDLTKDQVYISSSITSHETKIPTSMYKISHKELKIREEHKINQKIAEPKLVFSG